MVGADLQRLVLPHEQAHAVVLFVPQQLHRPDASLLPLPAFLIIPARRCRRRQQKFRMLSLSEQQIETVLTPCWFKILLSGSHLPEDAQDVRFGQVQQTWFCHSFLRAGWRLGRMQSLHW